MNVFINIGTIKGEKITMEKLSKKQCPKKEVERTKAQSKKQEKDVDLPRLTCDYLEQTLQIA